MGISSGVLGRAMISAAKAVLQSSMILLVEATIQPFRILQRFSGRRAHFQQDARILLLRRFVLLQPVFRLMVMLSGVLGRAITPVMTGVMPLCISRFAVASQRQREIEQTSSVRRILFLWVARRQRPPLLRHLPHRQRLLLLRHLRHLLRHHLRPHLLLHLLSLLPRQLGLLQLLRRVIQILLLPIPMFGGPGLINGMELTNALSSGLPKEILIAMGLRLIKSLNRRHVQNLGQVWPGHGVLGEVGVPLERVTALVPELGRLHFAVATTSIMLLMQLRRRLILIKQSMGM